ncbi:hypothetical protein [Actinomadura sp. GTD37]|uniref:hypothetical protein n=1 Tax=Actinomadura sp. GTD37 TaxID=1778030 RepID=UPI0035C1B45A
MGRGDGHARDVPPNDRRVPAAGPAGTGRDRGRAHHARGADDRGGRTRAEPARETRANRVWRAHILAERTMLHALPGHCNSPIAGHCHTTDDGQLSLIGMVFSRDGTTFAHAHEWDTSDHAYELGAFVAASLTRKDARSIIAGTRLH